MFTMPARRPQDDAARGETDHAAGKSTAVKEPTIMGDKSPKSVNKKSGQKQAASAKAGAQKKAVAATKSAAKKK